MYNESRSWFNCQKMDLALQPPHLWPTGSLLGFSIPCHRTRIRELAILFWADYLMPCVGAQPHALIISSVSTPHLSCFSTLALNHTRRLCISCEYITSLLLDSLLTFCAPLLTFQVWLHYVAGIPRSKPTFSSNNKHKHKHWLGNWVMVSRQPVCCN